MEQDKNFRFNDYQRAELENSFKLFNPDSTGEISYSAVSNVLVNLREASISNPIRRRTEPHASLHGASSICSKASYDYEKFISTVETTLNDPELLDKALHKVFDMMDLRKVGFVDKRDLMAIGHIIGEKITDEEEAMKLLSRVDAAGTRINFESLKNYVMNDTHSDSN